MKKIVFVIVALAAVLFAWYYSDLWLSRQGDQRVLREAQEELGQYQEENALLEDRIAQLEDEKDAWQRREAKLQEDLEEALLPAYLPLYHERPDASRRYVAESCALYFLPGTDQTVVATLAEGTLVDVFGETVNRKTGERFLFVQVPVYGDPEDNRGYIRKEFAVYFTPDLERNVIDPLRIAEGTTVHEVIDGVLTEARLEDDLMVRLLSVEDGKARVEAAGGRELELRQRDLVYPRSDIR